MKTLAGVAGVQRTGMRGVWGGKGGYFGKVHLGSQDAALQLPQLRVLVV